MCGIYFCCTTDGCDVVSDLQCCRDILSRRGPDFSQEKIIKYPGFSLHLYSSVLWLQGDRITEQPLVDEFENILMWNGDIFDIKDTKRNSQESDTILLSRLLSKVSSPSEMLELMSRIHGPWALVYYHKSSNTVWFGRDFFGRQSLLISNSEGRLCLTSTAASHLSQYQELPALGLYSCQLSGPDGGDVGQMELLLHPWDCLSLPSSVLTQLHCSLSPLSLRCPVIVQSNLSVLDLPSEDGPGLFSQLLLLPEVAELVRELSARLREAVVRRVRHQPGLCKDCVVSGRSSCGHPAVGVLFSGGLDSCLLASLAAEVLPPGQSLHLYNVAFQQPGGHYEVPDRLTGLQGYQELLALHPSRDIHFLQVDVTLQELQTARAERVLDLLHPLNTVLDDSIGCAVWLAGRGQGHDLRTGQRLKSRARVLLLGMGIDEQLGGYSRHRTEFSRHGNTGLAAELAREITNISQRNLGRDNRIVSDHGVAPRFPFLDENLVNFLAKVPINLKSSYQFGRGRGEKLLLRLLAHDMGLVYTALEPKRAVQFGSRIAKMENRKEKGAEVAVR